MLLMLAWPGHKDTFRMSPAASQRVHRARVPAHAATPVSRQATVLPAARFRCPRTPGVTPACAGARGPGPRTVAGPALVLGTPRCQLNTWPTRRRPRGYPLS